MKGKKVLLKLKPMAKRTKKEHEERIKKLESLTNEDFSKMPFKKMSKIFAETIAYNLRHAAETDIWPNVR